MALECLQLSRSAAPISKCYRFIKPDDSGFETRVEVLTLQWNFFEFGFCNFGNDYRRARLAQINFWFVKVETFHHELDDANLESDDASSGDDAMQTALWKEAETRQKQVPRFDCDMEIFGKYYDRSSVEYLREACAINEEVLLILAFDMQFSLLTGVHITRDHRRIFLAGMSFDFWWTHHLTAYYRLNLKIVYLSSINYSAKVCWWWIIYERDIESHSHTTQNHRWLIKLSFRCRILTRKN